MYKYGTRTYCCFGFSKIRIVGSEVKLDGLIAGISAIARISAVELPRFVGSFGNCESSEKSK